MKRRILVAAALAGTLLCSGCGTSGSGGQTAGLSGTSGKVNLAPIDSRIFSGAHYDGKTENLTLQFNHGATYQYAGVPKSVYKRFLKAEDKADFYRREIRTQYTGTYLLD